MSIAPILPGRLPNSYSFRRLNQQIQQGQAELQRLQDQLTTGQQYIVPSEDPSSALNTIVLQTRLERQQQFKANVQTDRSFLGATENALSTVSNAVNSAKSIILQGIGAQRGREVSLLNLQYFGEELIVPSGALPLSFQAVSGGMVL